MSNTSSQGKQNRHLKAKILPIYEMREMREASRKVFRLSDGSEKAVFYSEDVHIFNAETCSFDDIDKGIITAEDGKHFVGFENRFKAYFNREDKSAELFSIESDIYRVSVNIENSEKNKDKPIVPSLRKRSAERSGSGDVVVFENVAQGIDYE